MILFDQQKGGWLTSCLGILPDVFLNLELVGSRLVLGDHPPDYGRTSLPNFRPLRLEVIVKVLEANLGHNAGSALSDDGVFTPKNWEEALPAGDNAILPPSDEVQFALPKAVWKGSRLSREGQGGEGVRYVTLPFLIRGHPARLPSLQGLGGSAEDVSWEAGAWKHGSRSCL